MAGWCGRPPPRPDHPHPRLCSPAFSVEAEPGRLPKTALFVKFCTLERLAPQEEGGEGPFLVDDTLVVELQLEVWTAERLAARFRRRGGGASSGEGGDSQQGASLAAASNGS